MKRRLLALAAWAAPLPALADDPAPAPASDKSAFQA